MFDLIKKSVFTGIGLALKTKDEVETLARDLVEKGKMGEEEGNKFVGELLKKYEDSKNKLDGRVETLVKKFMKKADLVGKNELMELKKEIAELKETFNKPQV